MTFARQEQEINNDKSIDDIVLLKLQKLELDTEIHQSTLKQLELKIAIEKNDLESKELESLQSQIDDLRTSSTQKLLLDNAVMGSMLCLASYCGLYKTAEYLLDKGASTKAAIVNDNSRLDRIAEPFMKVGLDMREILSLQLVMNKYPLELALANQKNNLAELLVKKGANVDAIYTQSEPKPSFFFSGPPTLIYAATEKEDIFSVTFLASHGAAINQCDGYGNTPLHRAAVYGNIAIVLALLNSSADPHIKAKGNGNRRPEDLARKPEIKAVIKAYRDKDNTKNSAARCTIL